MNDLLPEWLMGPAAGPVWRFGWALLPVLVFLGVLVGLDSFRLVRRRRVALALIAGAAAAGLSYLINTMVLDLTGLSTVTFAIVAAPFVEEACKGAWIAWQIRQGRIGFLVDAAVLGFATGAGFALVENIYYLRNLAGAPLLVWLVRGLGTALMHGGATALLAVYLQGAGERSFGRRPWLGALFLASVVHAAFNRFMTEPVLATLVLLVVLPGLMFFVYRRGERRLRSWLGRGFDRDRELLSLITEGRVHDAPLGKYLLSLRENFRPDTVVDMLCLLRLQVELSLRAKGLLILREQGLEPAPDPLLADKLDELRWLERRIGKTGQLAMRPICHWRGAETWQRYLLEDQGGPGPVREDSR